MSRGLTAMQARFVDEYLIDLNATQACIRAGYSERNATRIGPELLGKTRVAAAVAERQQARSARTEITQDYVLTNAKEVLERCLERAPVMVRAGREWVQKQDDEGRDVWQFDARGAMGALTLLGKHVGIGGPAVNLNIDYDTLTDAQLEHVAKGGSLASLPR